MAGEYSRAGVDYPRNWHELLAWFPDEGACLRYLERLRWGPGFTCRFCGAVDGGSWEMSDGLRLRSPPLQSPHQQIGRLTSPTAESGERTG